MTARVDLTERPRCPHGHALADWCPDCDGARTFDPPALPLAALDWRDSSEERPRTRLLATLQIGGCSLHLEAFAVADDPAGVQQFVGDFHDVPEGVYAAVAADGPWQTVTIEGRRYVLIATPFCD